MIFKPSTVACSWDTYLFYKEGTHYLFYLFNSRRDTNWDGLGVATSSDGVHFTDQGPIIHKADDAIWLGGGMTWEVGGKYYLYFTELLSSRQEVNFAISNDLLHWQRLPYEEYVCRLDPRYYDENPILSTQRWDGIWVLPEENGNGFVGYLTTVAKDGPKGLCGTAGFVTSPDGIHFKAAPPVIETGFWGDGVEVAAVEKIGSLYYMLLGIYHAPLGARHLSRLPAGECGMYVVSSKSQTGPFTLCPDQPLLLGSSPTVFTYFARFYRLGSEILVNHHVIPRTTPHTGMNAGPDVMFAPLKKIHADDRGILSLRWWPGNEALKGQLLPLELSGYSFSRGLISNQITDGNLVITAPANAFAYLPEHFDIQKGIVLEATLTLQAPSGPLSSYGLFIEGQPAGAGSLVLAQTNNWLTVGPFNGFNFKPEDCKPFTVQIDRPVNWRLLLRGQFLEIYLDDVHIQSYTINHSMSGRLGWVIESGSARIRGTRIWEMTL